MNPSQRTGGLAALACLLLVACGGGGGSMMPAPSGLTYPSPAVFTIKQAISPLLPTVTGTVASYSVNPALPAGLGIDSKTGIISGTPTAVAAKSTYTVTAQNAGGSTTAGVSIVVNDVVPKIAYPSDAYSYSAKIAAQTVRPMSTGGAVVSWSVAPALPAGLTLNATDGSIGGTPDTATPKATYVITATNSGGQSTFNLMLGVGPAPILDVGHTNGLALLRSNGSAVLSLDAPSPALTAQSAGHWVLQDYASGAIRASGDLPVCANQFNCNDTCFAVSCASPVYPAVDLAGDTLIDPIAGGQFTYATGQVVSATSGVELRSATTGQVLTTIPGQFWWYQLAADGSYVITASDTSLTVYSRSGTKLFSLPGLYRTAIAFSTSAAIEIAFRTCPGNPMVCPSPGATNVIETVSVATGTASTALFQGAFYEWFQDGARFLTSQGSTFYTYSNSGAQLDSTTVQPFNQAGTAQGPYWWTWDEGSSRMLNIYKVGAGAPTAISGSPFSEPLFVSSGPTLGMFESMNLTGIQVRVIDLSGATPVSTTYSTPAGPVTAYAAASATAWFAGDDHGVVVDGASLASQPRFLTLGAVQSIAAGSSYYSVATASGQILDFSASTNTSVNTINFPGAALAMSSDGTVLAAAVGDFIGVSRPDASINIYSLPSATPINNFAYGSPLSVAISLSGSGTVLSQVPSNSAGCAAATVAVTGGAPIWCDTTGTVQKAQLSPDGTLVAASTRFDSSPNPTTSIYQNGVLTKSVPGSIVGWLDNSKFLVDNYQADVLPPHNTLYLGNIVYSSQGSVLGTPALPEVTDFRVASPNSVYSASQNIIYSTTTNSAIWMSGNSSSGVGAASSSQVIFTSGTLVLAQPH